MSGGHITAGMGHTPKELGAENLIVCQFKTNSKNSLYNCFCKVPLR